MNQTGSPTARTLCIAGASGLVGANLTKTALERGYRVRGSLRDATDPEKAPHLKALPGADERLELFSADMADPGSFDNALEGADAVFIACLIPTYLGPSGEPAREMDDEQGEREIVMPTVSGCLNILRSAARCGVPNALICSSTSSTNPREPVALKNEVDHWSDKDHQYEQKKYTSAAKTVMERAAIDFARENHIRLSIFLPTLMLGPAVPPDHAERGFQGMLNNMLAGEPGRHERVPDDSMSMIHVEDLARLFFAAYQNPDASGRYFGVYDSVPWQVIYDCLAELMPEVPMPEQLRKDPSPPTGFDFTRRDSLGVELRDVASILRETVESLRHA